jgi:hypothetical protein
MIHDVDYDIEQCRLGGRLVYGDSGRALLIRNLTDSAQSRVELVEVEDIIPLPLQGLIRVEGWVKPSLINQRTNFNILVKSEDGEEEELPIDCMDEETGFFEVEISGNMSEFRIFALTRG